MLTRSPKLHLQRPLRRTWNSLRSIKKGIKKLSVPKNIKGLKKQTPLLKRGLKMILPQTPLGMTASALLG